MADPAGLSGQEQEPGSTFDSAGTSETDQLAQHQNQVGNGYRPGDPKKSFLKRSLQKRFRKYIILGILPSVLLILGVLFFALFLPTLKIPQLAAHIEEYRLARLSQTFYKQATLLTADRAAIDATADTASADALMKSSKTGTLFATFRPRTVVNNMKSTGVLNFETDAKGRITTVNVGGRRVVAPKYNFGHPIQNYKERLRFGIQINSSVHDSLKGNNYLVRSRVSKLLLSGWGINLRWYEKLVAKSKYDKLTPAEADRQMLQDTTEETTTTTHDSKISGVNEAAEEAEQAKADCIKAPKCADDWIKNNRIPSSVTDKFNSIVDRLTSKPSFVLSFLNPIYAIGMPLCLIYDGSVEASNTFINNQNIAATKMFIAVASAADQQKKGDAHAKPVEAFNRRVGKIADSVPEQLAKGQKVDTSLEMSPQATKTGEFTVFNALFPSDTIAKIANSLANKLCPTITNTGISVGIALANVLAAILSGGSSEGAEGTIGTVVTTFIKSIGTKIAEKFTTQTGRATLKNTARQYAAGAAKGEAATQGGTYLARMLVLSEMGAFFDGTDSADFANQADAGGAVYANELNRKMSYGRPLAASEIKPAQSDALSYNASLNRNQSTFERYFAFSNPDSMATNFAMRLSGINFSSVTGFFTAFSHSLATLFSPLSHVLSPAAGAVSASDNSDYNVAQMGWSKEELNLIDNDATFDPLVNAQILTQSGQADNIEKKYGKCFTADTATLLTDGSVNRDDQGNIKPSDGLCSPANLGSNNAEFDKDGCRLTDGSAHKCDKLIFRWRWDQSNQNTLGELVDIQNPTEDVSPGEGGPISCDSPGFAPYDPGKWNALPGNIKAAIEAYAPTRKDKGAACGVVPNAHPSDPTKMYMGEPHFIDIDKPGDCAGDDLGNKGGSKYPGQKCIGIKYRDPLSGQQTEVIPIGGGGSPTNTGGSTNPGGSNNPPNTCGSRCQ